MESSVIPQASTDDAKYSANIRLICHYVSKVIHEEALVGYGYEPK
ncbi:MAG: hypothetical protein ACUVQY_04150 [Thermoproteota archaeon]